MVPRENLEGKVEHLQVRLDPVLVCAPCCIALGSTVSSMCITKLQR